MAETPAAVVTALLELWEDRIGQHNTKLQTTQTGFSPSQWL